MSNLEKEVKVILNKSEYDKLNNLLIWKKEYEQVNYYYGEDRSLHNSDVPTIRIRNKEQCMFLQVKIPIAIEGALHIKKEFEKKVEHVEEVISKVALKELTGVDFDSNVKLLGKLTTYRKECISFDNVEICLDKNAFFDMEDYELELEYSGDYPTNVIEYLKQNGIIFEKKTPDKFSRFIQQYVHQNVKSIS